MKVLIVCNHSYPQQGGSENVIDNISKSLCSEYGDECIIMSTSVKKTFARQSVSYIPLALTYTHFVLFCKRLNPDHILIYGDLFIHWADIVTNPKSLPFNKTIALVGMNWGLSDPYRRAIFKANHNNFNVIVHSDSYQDAVFCKKNDIPYHMIPNGVDLSEFEKSSGIDFREKYGIPKTNPIVLNVSNFFPGKGHEHFHSIFEKVAGVADVVNLVVICSTVEMNQASINEARFISSFENYPLCASVKVLKDIPREDTIAAFKAANIFAFPSTSEVAPLVILESMAAGLPYVSFNVGNIASLPGGLVIKDPSVDFGVVPRDEVFSQFAHTMFSLLVEQNRSRWDGLRKEGRLEIEKRYNWGVIVPQYRELFLTRASTGGRTIHE